MKFNLVKVIYWRVITSKKKQQVDIDNVCKNARRVSHDYAIGDLVYVDMTGIFCNVDYKKYGPYRITEVFTNGTI